MNEKRQIVFCEAEHALGPGGSDPSDRWRLERELLEQAADIAFGAKVVSLFVKDLAPGELDYGYFQIRGPWSRAEGWRAVFWAKATIPFVVQVAARIRDMQARQFAWVSPHYLSVYDSPSDYGEQ